MRRTLFLLNLKSVTDLQTSLRFAMYDSNMSSPCSVTSFFDRFGGGSHAMKTNLSLLKSKSCCEKWRGIKQDDQREEKCWKVCFDRITCKQETVSSRNCFPALWAMMHHVTTEELNGQRDTGNEIPHTLREPSGSIRTSELTDLEQMWWKSVLGWVRSRLLLSS